MRLGLLKYFIIVLGMLLSNVMSGQCPDFDGLIQKGDAYLNQKIPNYQEAINAYIAAIINCTHRAPEAQERISKMVNSINDLRAKAVISEAKAKEALDAVKKAESKLKNTLQQLEDEQSKTKAALVETERAKLQTDSALQKAKKLIDAFYFYDDRFALAFKNRQFYFIDKNGDEVSKLGKWQEAQQFDDLGFAKVKNESITYILDTLGNKYQVAYNINELNDTTEAVDITLEKPKSISDTIFKYRSLKVLILRNCDVDMLPQSIFNLSQLVEIHIFTSSYNWYRTGRTYALKRYGKFGLKELPNQLGTLSNLRKLNIPFCHIKEFPESITKLNNLIYINLQLNRITTIPETIGDLRNLTELDLGSNQIKSIPETIGGLRNLTKLDLSGNQITTIPETIGGLRNLTKLDLSGNQITTIPETIGDLKNLTDLRLYDNQITTIPETIGDLTGLAELYLYNNKITNIPETIGDLRNLTELGLWRNQITTIPETIGDLRNLTKLGLWRNQITTIPETIGDLRNLTELDLSGNQISTIPETIGDLRNLTELYLSGNQISTIPETIGDLRNLMKLGLWGNQITTIPETFGDLMNLTDLRLYDNQITNIPETIGDLTGLAELYLYNNKITNIPETIGNLKKLTSFQLDSNHITNIPETIGNLLALRQLGLRGNQIKSIPSSIGNLIHLEKLYLSNNQITGIPETIGNLKNLDRFSLFNNRISSLPTTMSELGNLTHLNLVDNTIPKEERKKIWKMLPNCEIVFLGDKSYCKIADKFFEEKKYEKALMSYLQSIEEEENTTNLGSVGMCYELLNNDDKALEYFYKYLEVKPNNTWTLKRIASVYSNQKNMQKAFEYQKIVCELDKDEDSNWFNLSWYSLFVDKPQEAIGAAQKVLELDSENVSVETNLALGYLLNNEYSKATEIYKKWKGKNFPEDDRLCDDIFLADISDLENYGIHHKDFKKVRAIFKK